MGSSRFQNLASALILTFVSFAALAGPSHGMALNQEAFEARGACSSGACLGNLDAPGVSQLKGLLHKISIFDEDDRVYQTKKGKGIGFAPIGGIVANQDIPNPKYNPRDPKSGPKMVKNASSTGTLVSPCHVLTDYHSVAGGAPTPKKGDKRAEAEFAKKYTANFYVGTDSDELYEVKGKPVKWGLFVPKMDIEEDWMLLEIENCVGLDKDIGWMEIDGARGNQAKSMQVAMAGYPADRDSTQLSLDPSCKLAGLIHSKGAWEHNCASRPGASGSPIFYLDESGVPYMVAMHGGSFTPPEGDRIANLDADREVIPSSNPKSANYTNYAVNMGRIYDEIRSELYRAKDQFNKENPVIAKLRNGGSEVVSPASAPAKKSAATSKKSAGTDI